MATYLHYRHLVHLMISRHTCIHPRRMKQQNKVPPHLLSQPWPTKTLNILYIYNLHAATVSRKYAFIHEGAILTKPGGH